MFGAKIGEPIPAKYAFDANNDVLNEGKHQFKEQLRIGFDVFVNLDFSLLVNDAHIHFSGMKIDAAVVMVLLVVKSHGVASFSWGLKDLGIIPFYTLNFGKAITSIKSVEGTRRTSAA